MACTGSHCLLWYASTLLSPHNTPCPRLRKPRGWLRAVALLQTAGDAARVPVIMGAAANASAAAVYSAYTSPMAFNDYKQVCAPHCGKTITATSTTVCLTPCSPTACAARLFELPLAS